MHWWQQLVAAIMHEGRGIAPGVKPSTNWGMPGTAPLGFGPRITACCVNERLPERKCKRKEKKRNLHYLSKSMFDNRLDGESESILQVKRCGGQTRTAGALEAWLSLPM